MTPQQQRGAVVWLGGVLVTLWLVVLVECCLAAAMACSAHTAGDPVLDSVKVHSPRIKPLGTEACSVTPPSFVNGSTFVVACSGFEPGLHLGVTFEDTPTQLRLVDSDAEGGFALTYVGVKFPHLGGWVASVYLNDAAYIWQTDRRNFVFAQAGFEVE